MPKRELSCFLCKELLYEYLVNSVDEKRRETINKHLETCSSCKAEFEALKTAQQYLAQLSKIEILPAYLAKVSTLESFSSRVIKNAAWKKWPDPLKWTVESLAVGVVIAFLFTVVTKKIFVHKAGGRESFLVAEVSQIPKNSGDAKEPDASKESQEAADDEASELMAGGAGEDAIETAVSPTQEPKTPVLTEKKPAAIASQESSPVPPPEPVKKVTQGFVYRANMVTDDLDAVTPEVVTKIQEMGGKKAGEVQLGWRQMGGSYFHFSLPESEYANLLEFLKQKARLQISKDSNKRVMPKGLIRIILVINPTKHKKSASEEETDSPSVPVKEAPSEAVPNAGPPEGTTTPPSEVKSPPEETTSTPVSDKKDEGQ